MAVFIVYSFYFLSTVLLIYVIETGFHKFTENKAPEKYEKVTYLINAILFAMIIVMPMLPSDFGF